MSKAGVIAAVIILTAILVGAGFYIVVLSNNSAAIGFDSTKLNKPVIAHCPDQQFHTPAHGDRRRSRRMTTSTSIGTSPRTSIAGYGGALDLTVKNNNPGKLFIYAFGLEWASGELLLS